MSVRIELLGTPEIARGELRTAAGPMLLCLAAAHPDALRRDDLIAFLYEGHPTAEARNRLRVGLTRLRRSVPLLESGDRVGLHPELVRVDVHELRKRLREIALEPEADAEMQALERLLPQLGTVLFPQATTAWELEAQSAWSHTATAALERLGDLAEQAADNVLAAAAAEASMRHFPYEAPAWERYLRGMTRLGRVTEAARRLAAARKQARADGWAFPESLDAWVSLSDGRDSLGPELAPGESLALERFFRRTLASEPELAVQMLGSTSFRPEVLRAPKAVLPLLREALSLPVGPSEARERIEVRVIGALSLAEEYPAVLEAVARFLSHPVAPARRRIALLTASFAHAMQGDLNRAMASVEEAIALASGPNAEYDTHECRAQRATFLMFAGELDTAEAEIRETLAYMEARALEGAEPDRLSVRGNLGLCLVHQGRYREAVEALRPVVDTARTLNLHPNLALSAPPLGFALAQLGGDVGTLLSEGLRAAYRMGPRRAMTAAGYAGRALHASGDDPSLRVLTEALGFRLSQGPQLQALESDLYAPVLDQRTETSRPLVDFIRATIRATVRAGAGA